jgi:hypothetical protein
MPLPPPLQKILAGAAAGAAAAAHQGDGNDNDNDNEYHHKYTYPTDVTQGIIPKPIHSHNDYWRAVPFYSALSVGAISVEADVWLVNGSSGTTTTALLVGHEPAALTRYRTFDALYVQPILAVLQRQNAKNSVFGGKGSSEEEGAKNGVFDTSPGQTLYLYVDIKTDGDEAWPAVVRALEPLRAAGYLTTFNTNSNGTGTTTTGPVTVVGTGNTPLHRVQEQSPRDIFYDAPLALLDSTFSNLTSAVSKMSSAAFSAQFGTAVRDGKLNATGEALLQSQIAVAHERGIGVRYWDQPNWPVSNRNALWRLLWAAGVDLINVDDLEGAANL